MSEQTPAQSPPRMIRLAVGALILSALAGVGTALSMYGQRPWLTEEMRKAREEAAKKDGKTADLDSIPSAITQVLREMTIQSVLLAVLVLLFAWSAWRGRPFVKWGLFAFWVLLFFMYAPNGPGGIFTINSDFPIGYRVAALVSSVAYLVALFLVNVPSSVAWFEAHRAVPRAPLPPRGERPAFRDLLAGRTGPAQAAPPATPSKGRATTSKRPPVHVPPSSSSGGTQAPRPASKSRSTGKPKGK